MGCTPLQHTWGVWCHSDQATKSSLKYGKCHVGILVKQRHVLDTVLEALLANSEHYHAVLQHKLTGLMDPFSGKEAVTYSWHSQFDLHYIRLVWEEADWDGVQEVLLADALPALTNENIGHELLYHSSAPLTPRNGEMTNRVANLMTIHFGPHLLQAWYDTLSPGLSI